MNRKEVLLLLVLLTCYMFFVQWSGAEQRSFFALILALNNEHTLRIDRYADLTPDKALYNGHYYSDKAPGLAFLGLPVYAVANAMQHLNRPGLFLPYSIHMVSAFVVSLPAALLALLVLRFLRRIGVAQGHAVAVTLAMALGTLACPFSTLFFSHQTTAFFVFAAFYALYRVKEGDIAPTWALLLGGLLVGIGVVLEYPMAIMAILLLVYALSFMRDRRRVIFYVLGGLPPALLLMLYNYLAFEHPLRFSYFFEANTWAQVHKQGVLGLGVPQWDTFLTVTLGPRGLFTLSPILLLAVYGLALMARERQRRAEGLLSLAAFGVYLVMISGYMVPPTDIWAPGPRFLVPVLPFLAAPLAHSLPRLRWLFVPLAAISIAIMFLATSANPQVPPEVTNPLFEHWLPGFLNRSHLVHSVAELRFGISRGLGMVLLAAVLSLAALAVLLAWLLRHRPRTQSAALGVFVIIILIGYLVVAFPIDLRRPFDVPARLVGPTAQLLP